jgi:dihydrofolate synthase / folylpolyglutamate synthase
MILEKLDRYINNETRSDFKNYGLGHVRKILEHYGDPQKSFRSIHIAGTNGKGSVAYMLHSIFSGAGYATGLYTSPHLLEINERIRINDRNIPDRDFSAYINDIIDYAESETSIHPTFFDILTVCAFLYFRDSRVDAAIVETGIGGRLDSTNVIDPLVSIITEISYDHMHILGTTLQSIAYEKAGIIKPGVPVVTSNTDPAVLDVLADRSRICGARVLVMGRDFSSHEVIETGSGFRYDYRTSDGISNAINAVEIPHPLEKQIANSCCAITAAVQVREHFPAITDDSVRDGLARFTAPARFQTLLKDPMVLYDPAHNVAALSEMVRLVEKLYPDRTVTLVLTLMKDKDISAIMTLLKDFGTHAIYYALDDTRCYQPGPGSYPEVIGEIIHADEKTLFLSLDRIRTDHSLFFFTGTFRHYRTALNYSVHRR